MCSLALLRQREDRRLALKVDATRRGSFDRLPQSRSPAYRPPSRRSSSSSFYYYFIGPSHAQTLPLNCCFLLYTLDHSLLNPARVYQSRTHKRASGACQHIHATKTSQPSRRKTSTNLSRSPDYRQCPVYHYPPLLPPHTFDNSTTQSLSSTYSPSCAMPNNSTAHN